MTRHIINRCDTCGRHIYDDDIYFSCYLCTSCVKAQMNGKKFSHGKLIDRYHTKAEAQKMSFWDCGDVDGFLDCMPAVIPAN